MRKKKVIPQMEKKSRAKYKCPSGLARALKEFRRVHPATNLPESKAIFDKNKLSNRPDLSKEARQNLLFERNKKVLEECVKDFSGDYARLLFAACFHKRSEENSTYPEFILKNIALFDALEEYDKFREQRNLLRSIAQFFTQLRIGNNLFEGVRNIETSDGNYLELPTLPPARLSREGTIGKVESPIDKEFSGLNLDRIRECEICNHLFWAANKNSFTCSENCRNALRQRSHRKKNKEEINRKRRRNYYYKEGILYCEKCIFPNTKCSCYLNERSKNNVTL